MQEGRRPPGSMDRVDDVEPFELKGEVRQWDTFPYIERGCPWRR